MFKQKLNNINKSGKLKESSSSIYIHIPFCKQACYYCDFHFSTSFKKKDDLIQCLAKEIELKRNILNDKSIDAIYFGGGTPSVLSVKEINFLLDAIYKNYTVSESPEITLEANPDDLSEEKIIALSKTKINRLSIGIQSFFDYDLKLMNRAHTAKEAKKSLETAITYFSNISIDLIYGIPDLSNERWIKNIHTALRFGVPHISSYALTVEEKTPLESFIKKGIIKNVDDDKAEEQFHILINELQKANFIHYELSNFGKKNYFSRNNTGYWQGKYYIGIGPAAHSFLGKRRSWNVRNNSKYIRTIQQNSIPEEIEMLTKTDQFNEYIMTGLRTIWGVDFNKVTANFGEHYVSYLKEQASNNIKDGFLIIENNTLFTTKKGKFLSDGLASDLFLLNSERIDNYKF